MSDDNEQPIKSAIEEMMKLYGMEDKMIETRLKAEWEDIAGKMIASHTRKMFLYKEKLFITFDAASLKQDLMYLKDPLKLKINQHFKKELIKEIVFK